MGLASIYRALERLHALGLVQRLDAGDGQARYERALPGGEHHHHAVCEGCGELTPFEDAALERAIERLGRDLELQVTAHDVVIHGRCPDCERAMSTALTASGLTVRFGSKTAIEDITFEIPRGRSVAVLGPNGAGKSTLFAAAVGLVRPSAGRIEAATDRVALVPQRLDLEPGFPVTTRDVVRMGRYGDLGPLDRFRDEDHRLVAESIERLGIEDVADERFGVLSGGERQRALLAQAAAQNPELLLLDEPFSGVDAAAANRVSELIDTWRSEGRSVLVATHDLRSAARDYDLVLAVNRRLVAFGPAAETCTEEVLAETFAGKVVRVGDLVFDIAHHHHGAG